MRRVSHTPEKQRGAVMVLVVAGLVYLALTIPMTRIVARIEKRAAQSK